MRVGVYAGSFDPLHWGHIHVLKEAQRLFDRVIVCVASNPEKKDNLLSTDTRVRLFAPHLDEKTSVHIVPREFLVNYIRDRIPEAGQGFWLIRGIRNGQDLEMEQAMARVNEQVSNGRAQTLFVPPSDGLEDLSSSLIRGLIGPRGWRRIVKEMVPDAVYTTLRDRIAEKVFRHHLNGGLPGIRDEFTDKAVKTVMEAYAQPQRHYHTIEHILSALEHLELMEEQGRHAENLWVVEMAIWFHDIVYEVPGLDKQNEKLSADLAVRTIQAQAALNLKVRQAILCTDGVTAAQTEDERMVVEADLSILGAPRDIYMEYIHNIRREYEMAPDEIFYPARTRVMKTFLEKPIFTTPGLEFMNTRARNNISDEVHYIEQNRKA